MPLGRHLSQRRNWLLTSGIESTMPFFQGRGPKRMDDMAVTACGSMFLGIAVTAFVLINGVPAGWTAGSLLTSAAAASRGTYLAYRRVRIS